MPDDGPANVAPGVWGLRARRPAGGDPARFYAIESAGGFVLVDGGWGTDESRAALAEGLAAAGGTLDDIHGIALTHLHPDHCGLAEELRERTGAWIAASPDEAVAAKHRHGTNPSLVAEIDVFLRQAGAPEPESAAMLEWRRQTSRNAPIIEIDIPLADGDELDVPGRTLVAISTPGHSAGHLCFHDPGNRLLFAGDVVLPKRNPPIGSFALDEQVDPLSDFFDSLDRLAELDGCLVLPGHGDPFTGPAADAERLRSHHEKRMRALTAYLASGPVTLWEAAVAAPWSQPWEDLSPMAKLLSLGKVHAHLIALIRRGLVRRLDSDVARYVLAETPAIRTTGPVSA